MGVAESLFLHIATASRQPFGWKGVTWHAMRARRGCLRWYEHFSSIIIYTHDKSLPTPATKRPTHAYLAWPMQLQGVRWAGIGRDCLSEPTGVVANGGFDVPWTTQQWWRPRRGWGEGSISESLPFLNG